MKVYQTEMRRNSRTGDREVEALDPKKKLSMKEIFIPDSGYILKPNEVYMVEVNDPGNPAFHEDNFVTDLTKMGVSCRILDDDVCRVTVERPIRFYPDMELFYEDRRTQ